jgi:hypothetical protein
MFADMTLGLRIVIHAITGIISLLLQGLTGMQSVLPMKRATQTASVQMMLLW